MSIDDKLAIAAESARNLYLDGSVPNIMQGCIASAGEYGLNANDIWDEHEARLDREVARLLDRPSHFHVVAVDPAPYLTDDGEQFIELSRPMARMAS